MSTQPQHVQISSTSHHLEHNITDESTLGPIGITWQWKYYSSAVGMGNGVGMAWWEWKHYFFPFPTQSKEMGLYCGKKDRYWRKVVQFRHLYFKFNFQLFLCQKTSISCEFTGYLFHDVHENSNRCNEID